MNSLKPLVYPALIPATCLCLGLLLTSTLQAAEPVEPPVTSSPAPLHEHSSIEPASTVTPAVATKPAPTSVPEQTAAPTMEEENKIVIVNRPQVSGLWAMTIPGARCVEYYNFMENGEVVVQSGAEWTYGTYVYQVPAVAEPGLPVLAMRIQYDNLQTDCSGNAIDQRGEEQQQYVKWTGPSSMQFCAGQEASSHCFASLNRVLP
jgi:hypothetical protein